MLQTETAHIKHFQTTAEEIQRDHIKSKVHKIGVDKPAGKEPIILISHSDRRGPEDKSIHQPGIRERCYRDETGKDKNDHRDRLGHRNFLAKYKANYA
jgi:hypothetical protein